MQPESFREGVTAVKRGRKRKDGADERRGNDPESTNEQEAREEEQQQIEAGFWSRSFPRIRSRGDGKKRQICNL